MCNCATSTIVKNNKLSVITYSHYFRSKSRVGFYRAIAFFTACLFANPLFALEFECESGADKRFIRMELPGIDHLCEVTVTNALNERKVMWYANQDSMFCTDKTNDLSNKYQNEWGFQCSQWPDHDGIDALSKRQRTIVDSEVKTVIADGKKLSTQYVVEGLKAVSNENNLLVLQFFLHEPQTSITRDITHIINDLGSSYNLASRLGSLAEYVDANEGYVVNSALISSVTDNGAMEIITVLDSEDAPKNSTDSGCYGNQTLTQQDDGVMVPRSPHRFVCPDGDSG